MLGKLLVMTAIGAVVALGMIFQTTTPDSAGALGVLAVFVLAYMLVLSVLTFFIWGVSFMIARAARGVMLRRPVERLGLRRAYYFASVLAIAPVIVISLQSVSGVSGYELGLIALLAGLGCVYVAKRTT